jgi:UDP-3-O-[3-hydroxymyristoyl] glucosamine N-acyltransferase
MGDLNAVGNENSFNGTDLRSSIVIGSGNIIGRAVIYRDVHIGNCVTIGDDAISGRGADIADCATIAANTVIPPGFSNSTTTTSCDCPFRSSSRRWWW